MSNLLFQQNMVAPGFGFSTGRSTISCARIAISSTELLALNTSPVSLLPAPAPAVGAGNALILQEILFQFVARGTQYTGGGALIPVYHGKTTDLTGLGGLAASVVTGASSDNKFIPCNGGVADVLPNLGIDLMADTANFAAGTGTLIVTVFYTTTTLG